MAGFLTIPAAAAQCERAVEELLAAIKAGQLPASKADGVLYVTPSDVADWADKPIAEIAADGGVCDMQARHQAEALTKRVSELSESQIATKREFDKALRELWAHVKPAEEKPAKVAGVRQPVGKPRK